MTLSFLIIAAVMVVVALACALVPMLHSARHEGRPRAPFWLAFVLVLVVPPVVLGAYLMLGTPQALQPAPDTQPGSLAEAAQQLRASLAKKPGNAEGWTLLSQAYSALNQPQQAKDALQHVLKLKPNDPDAMVAFVEAAAETNPAHMIDDVSRKLLQRAIEINPNHQRALWLLGISDVQRKRYADAATRWKTLLPLLQPGSKVAVSVQQELAEAEARVQGLQSGTKLATVNSAPAASSKSGDSAVTSTVDDVALKVTVKLDPKLAGEVKPGETLFVFARAIDGPPMPLAVARLSASTWPARVTLTDAMAMTPALRLSQFSKVRVVARISKSGNALPHTGDLESSPVQVATDTRDPIALTIDRVD